MLASELRERVKVPLDLARFSSVHIIVFKLIDMVSWRVKMEIGYDCWCVRRQEEVNKLSHLWIGISGTAHGEAEGGADGGTQPPPVHRRHHCSTVLHTSTHENASFAKSVVNVVRYRCS